MQPRDTSALQDDRFLLLSRLGGGGMASVFRAFDRIEQRLVALKVQTESLPAGPAHPLAAEYDAWSRLRHPNVVEAYGLVIARRGPLPRGTPYLVLEHVPGRPVHEALRPGRIPPAEFEAVGVALLRALQHVHAAGLLHRDVKPANVLVEPEAGRPERIKLTDFGLATPAGEAEEPGRISGSLPFVAPEVLLGRPLDSRSDLYSLGIVLNYLATGELPAGGSAPAAVLRWHLAGPPAEVRRWRPRFPPRLARFVRRLTEREPGRRPTDAREALDLLGGRPDPSRTEAVSATTDRAERARLRLALDAARLGARRRFVLPHGEPAATSRLIRQARVWAEIFGLGFHDLGTAPQRLVLSLLLDGGGATRRLALRHRLERWLPIATVAGVPLADAAREGGREPHGNQLRALARFLVDCAERRGLVLVADPATPQRRRSDQLAAQLRRTLPHSPSGAASGGLLLLDGSGAR